MTRGLVLVAALLASPPVLAQDHSGHEGHGHHAGHGAQAAPPPADPPPADAHAGHGVPRPGPALPPVGAAPPPAPPADHAADALFDPAAMARARKALLHEAGGMTFGSVGLDLAELRTGKGRDAYHWEGEAWFGGDIERALIRTEGEGDIGGGLESAEVQALYARALDPWWNLAAGIRHDFRPGPQRTYAVLGVEGLAPYWVHASAAAFLSDKGDAHLRLEASHDMRITQRLILQPRAEADLALQDVPELATGSGLSQFELALRLRYELDRRFAPYVGLAWERKLGGTARMARAAGEDPSRLSGVFGLRFWF